jgi:hypothetical protein
VSGRKRAAAAIRRLFASRSSVPARIRLERRLAAGSALLAVATLVWRDWIELVFRVDPDRGSGALEWAILGGSIAVSVVFAALARHESQNALAPRVSR